MIEACEKRCDVSLTLIRAYEVKGACNKAISIFQATYERDPSSRINWQALVRGYHAQDLFDKVIEISVSVLENYQFEERLLAYSILYRASRKKGDFDEAIRACESRIDKNPKEVAAWSYLARIYKAKDDYDRALHTLELGLLENPRNWLLSPEFADMVMKADDPADAIQTLRTAIQKDHIEIRAALTSLAHVYKKLGDRRAWIAELKRIARRHPSNFQVLHFLSEAWIESGEYEDAIKTVNCAIENMAMEPFQSDLLFRDIYKAYKANGEYTKALEVFESKVKSHVKAACSGPFWVSALWGLYDSKRDTTGAVEMFEGIVSATNNNEEWGWPGLLRAYGRTTDFAEHLFRFEMLVDENAVELSPRMAIELLDAFSATGSQDQIVDKFTKIVHRLPCESWPWHLLGEERTSAVGIP